MVVLRVAVSRGVPALVDRVSVACRVVLAIAFPTDEDELASPGPLS